MRTLACRRLDEPGMEVAHIESFSRASGTQLGVTYEMRWSLEGELLEVEVVGASRMTVPLNGADFFDVFASPFFNSLPVMRDHLLEPGPARDYEMRFVTVPGLEVVRSLQRYTPRGANVIRYSSGTFEADIEFDDQGFVRRYEGFLERVT